MTFTPTYLYIKQHNITKLKYFGKTVKDPLTYQGSGTYWKRHLNIYGSDIDTIWFQLFESKDELVKIATNFSLENNIVESKEWANLAIERGLDGGPRINSHFKIFNKIPHTQEHNAAISKANKGIARRKCPIEINGIKYESILDASRRLNKSEGTIHKWLKTNRAIRLPESFKRNKESQIYQ